MVTLTSNYKLLFSAAKAVVDVGPDMSQQSCAMTAGLCFLQDQGEGGHRTGQIKVPMQL